MAYHQPFDLYWWFVNVFAGNETIFLAIALVTIAIMAGMFRMPLIITGMIFAIFVFLLGVITGNVYILVVAIIGIIIALIVSRWVK